MSDFRIHTYYFECPLHEAVARFMNLKLVFLLGLGMIGNIQANTGFHEDVIEEIESESIGPEKIDRAQLTITDNLNDFAQWVDGFFDDDRVITEEAYTRLRIGQAVIFEEGESVRYKIKGNLKINIPRFKNKVNLFLSDDDSELSRVGSTENTDLSNRDEDTSLGLQFFARTTRKKNLSLSTGVKLDSMEFFIGPRYRRTSIFDIWQTRFTQRIRWFSQKSWQATTSFDQERLITDRALFRNTLEGRWRKQKPGYQIQLNPSVVFKLENQKALEYRLSNEFITKPEYRLDRAVFSIRHRQQFLRDWLYLELQPQLSFSHNNDFDPTPGFIVRLEVVFGKNSQGLGL